MSAERIPQAAESVLACDERPKVLIVDDEPALVEILCMRLEYQGYRTRGTYDGKSALRIAREETPDAIILDLCLPDRHGLSVCRELADDPATCAIPVLILSGADEPNLVRKARAAGGHFFVSKPYDPNVLLLVLRQALGQNETWHTDVW